MLRNVTIEGKIPDHESFNFEVKNAENRDKAVISFMLSVRRNFKKKDDQYYKDDLIPVKAFGANAQFIGNNFQKGSFIAIEGELAKDDDYNDEGGNKHYGNLYVSVNKIHFPVGGSASTEKTPAAPATAKTSAKPKSALAAAVNINKKKTLSGIKAPISGGLKRASIIR